MGLRQLHGSICISDASRLLTATVLTAPHNHSANATRKAGGLARSIARAYVLGGAAEISARPLAFTSLFRSRSFASVASSS
jgi:hypothetical protein